MTRFGASGPGGPIARPRPIVGRTGERAVLQRARERAQAGEPTVVRIEGDAGLGKSALLRDLVRGDATGTALVRDGAAALDALGATPFAARARAANDGAEPARGPEPAPAGPATRPAGPPVGAPGEAPRTTTYQYDPSGRFVVQTTQPNGLQTHTTYHPLYGLPLTQTDPYGRTTTYQYDD